MNAPLRFAFVAELPPKGKFSAFIADSYFHARFTITTNVASQYISGKSYIRAIIEPSETIELPKTENKIKAKQSSPGP